jgi:hypothetical protein
MMYLNKAFFVAPVVEKPKMIFKFKTAAVETFVRGITKGSGKI